MSHPSPLPPSESRLPPQRPTGLHPNQYELLHNLRLDVTPTLEGLISRFLNILEDQMSKLSDAVAALTKSIDDAVARNQTTVADLNQQIAALKAQLAAGGLSAAEEDALADQLTEAQKKADALNASNPTTLPPADGGPPPVPAPAPTDGGTPPVPAPAP